MMSIPDPEEGQCILNERASERRVRHETTRGAQQKTSAVLRTIGKSHHVLRQAIWVRVRNEVRVVDVEVKVRVIADDEPRGRTPRPGGTT